MVFRLNKLCFSRAVAQSVNRWPFIAEVQVHAQVDPCGICGGQIALGQVFLQVLWFAPASIIPPLLHIHLSLPHEVYDLVPKLGASFLTWHFGCKQNEKVKKKLCFSL
jgi:hypothetical protein